MYAYIGKKKYSVCVRAYGSVLANVSGIHWESWNVLRGYT